MKQYEEEEEEEEEEGPWCCLGKLVELQENLKDIPRVQLRNTERVSKRWIFIRF